MGGERRGEDGVRCVRRHQSLKTGNHKPRPLRGPQRERDAKALFAAGSMLKGRGKRPGGTEGRYSLVDRDISFFVVRRPRI